MIHLIVDGWKDAVKDKVLDFRKDDCLDVCRDELLNGFLDILLNVNQQEKPDGFLAVIKDGDFHWGYTTLSKAVVRG